MKRRADLYLYLTLYVMTCNLLLRQKSFVTSFLTHRYSQLQRSIVLNKMNKGNNGKKNFPNHRCLSYSGSNSFSSPFLLSSKALFSSSSSSSSSSPSPSPSPSPSSSSSSQSSSPSSSPSSSSSSSIPFFDQYTFLVEPGTIYFVATPLGNLGDLTFRAFETLRQVDYIASEDTRTTGLLLQKLGLPKKSYLSYHKFNEVARSKSLLEKAAQGYSIAIVSDAGTPGISDPGAILANEVWLQNKRIENRKNGEKTRETLEGERKKDVFGTSSNYQNQVKLQPIPGPCAAISAMSISGFLPGEFTFLGFLPQQSSKRKKKLLDALSQGLSLTNGSGSGTPTRSAIVLYEAPHRLKKVLKTLIEINYGEEQILIARELTKKHEDIFRGSIYSALLYYFPEEYTTKEEEKDDVTSKKNKKEKKIRMRKNEVGIDLMVTKKEEEEIAKVKEDQEEHCEDHIEKEGNEHNEEDEENQNGKQQKELRQVAGLGVLKGEFTLIIQPSKQSKGNCALHNYNYNPNNCVDDSSMSSYSTTSMKENSSSSTQFSTRCPSSSLSSSSSGLSLQMDTNDHNHNSNYNSDNSYNSNFIEGNHQQNSAIDIVFNMVEMEKVSVSEAVKRVSKSLGMKKSTLYNAVLAKMKNHSYNNTNTSNEE